MEQKNKGKNAQKKACEYEVVFTNALEPSVYRRYLEQVISANLKEHVPAHQQEPLLKRFAEAGLISSKTSR